MGQWSLIGITGTTSLYQSETVGHNVMVTYKLKYDTSLIGSFTELPILEWNEQFFMIEHHKGEWWEFGSNMYKHNPSSKTLVVWPSRYIVAYDTANGTPYGGKGSAKLFTKAGLPVKGSDLAKATNNAAKADAVRNYLKKNGGILEIKIHDIPSINKPDLSTHKERLLVFDCGFAGGGNRFKGAQYLNMNGAKPPANWVIDFQNSAGKLSQIFTDNTSGLRKVPPPVSVSAPRGATFMAGECW